MQVAANGLSIEVEEHGSPSGEPLLLVMGLGMQLTSWPPEFVQMLVAHGFRVIRFDNRDVGLSQGFDHLGVPPMAWAALRWMVRAPLRPAYTLRDMAADAIGVMDALRLERAHVCGASLGGMLAQHLAAENASRVKSLTLMMTTSGSRRLPGPTWAAQRALMGAPASRALPDLVAHMAHVFRVIGSPAYPPDPQLFRERIAENLARAYRPAGTMRQLAAVAADGDRSPLLARITAPTRVIHGEADPLVPVACGRDLAARIAGAQGDFIPGMGHDLPQALLQRFADGIAFNATRA
jgi:pimeloyl-ACP methyl ester carboxylesterase